MHISPLVLLRCKMYVEPVSSSAPKGDRRVFAGRRSMRIVSYNEEKNL